MKWNIKYLLLLLAFVSCARKQKDEKVSEVINTKSFSEKSFNAISNFPNANDLVSLDLDYSGAIDQGFIIPSIKQAKEGVFVCTFSIKNNNAAPADFHYKIFYQNESYKFNEFDSSTSKFNPLASENFYGSWENTDITFRKTSSIPADGEYHTIIDSIRIVGNPRNETLYFSDGKNDRWKRNPRVGNYSFLLVVTSEEN